MKNTKFEPKPQVLFQSGQELFSDFANHQSEFVKSVVPDDSLRMFGFRAEDLVFIKKTDSFNENQLSCWNLPDGSLVMGFAYDNFGDISLNLGSMIVRHKKNRLTLVGVAVGVMRCTNDLTANPIDYKEPEEMTVVCHECKTETTGTFDFLKSQGWLLGEKKQFCLKCHIDF